jgi:hypothetical protein
MPFDSEHEIERFGLRVILFYFRDMERTLEEDLATNSIFQGQVPQYVRDFAIAGGLNFGSVDITRFCKRITWSESITPPWGQVNVDIVEDTFHSLNIADNKLWPGWLSVQARSVRNPDRFMTLQAAYVTAFEQTLASQKDGSITDTVRLAGHSFLDLCRYFSLQICTIVQGNELAEAHAKRLLDGAMFSVEDWVRIAGDIVGDLPTEDVGVAVRTAWENFARVYAPQGAFNGTRDGTAVFLSDLVHVQTGGTGGSPTLRSNNHVHGETDWTAVTGAGTAAARTRPRGSGHWVTPVVPGFSIAALQNSMSFGGSFAGFLQQSFVADPGFVEMFPVISGNQAHLIYRMGPFRVMGSSDYARFIFAQTQPAVVGGNQGGGPQAVDSPRTFNFSPADADTWFGNPTWRTASADHISGNDITAIHLRYSDPDRATTLVTATWPSMPDAYAFICGQTGLPIVDDMGLLTKGPRVYRPSWPFLPNLDTAESTGGTMATWRAQLRIFGTFIKAIALEAAQYRMNLEYMGFGSIDATYSPQVRCGRPLAVHWAPNAMDMANFESAAANAAEGTFTVTGVPTKIDYAYTSSIEHTIEAMNNGTITGKSKIQIDRYLPMSKEAIRHSPINSDAYYRFRYGVRRP